MRSPHNAEARFALHSVAARLFGEVSMLDGFTHDRNGPDWRAFSAECIERLAVELVHLSDVEVGKILAARAEQRRAYAMREGD